MGHHYGRPYSVPDWVDTLFHVMPATMTELAQRTGRPKGTIKHWMAKLRAARWVHVGDWRRCQGDGHGGKKQPVFKPGQGKDKPPPPTLTKKECVDRCRAKAVKDGRYEFQLAKARAAKKAARVRKRGKPATIFDLLM